MNITAIKTRILQPPKDNLFKVLDEYLPKLAERDVLVVSSKVVAIHQGRCVPVEGSDKDELVKQESEIQITRPEDKWSVSIKYHALLFAAGIDESNAREHYVLLPTEPHKVAQEIRLFLKEKYGVTNVGVVIADSHSVPFRYGTVGVSIGYAGFEPVSYYTGEKDLFGRELRYTRINVGDALAVSGVFAMGESTEQTPLCLIRNIPHITFTERDTSGELTIPPREDLYWPLFRDFYERE